jgi:Na+(H+)/acetate symporter ActP
MSTQMLTYLVVGVSLALYIGIAICSRASSTKDFYVAGGGVHPVVNGMATAAEWMSAASFISMAGIISFSGSVAAALSNAAGLLLVISSAISHDLLKKTLLPKITEKQELLYARIAAAVAVCIAGLFGIYPPAFVAQVVAFAFGLAAASLFPALLLGIFSKRTNKEGAISGMLLGLVFTFTYIGYFKFVAPELNSEEHWLWGISPDGIGTIGMVLNLVIALTVSHLTAPIIRRVG